jgi:hypothetical protein
MYVNYIPCKSLHRLVTIDLRQAHWQDKAEDILCNATFLKNQEVTLRVQRSAGAEANTAPSSSTMHDTVDVRVFGTDFFWPMTTPNPHYALIPPGIDILVSHGPCKGMVDNKRFSPTAPRTHRETEMWRGGVTRFARVGRGRGGGRGRGRGEQLATR